MSVIQCSGFSVTELGLQALVYSAGQNPAPWCANAVFPTSRVLVAATGEQQTFQVPASSSQDNANLVAMTYGNKAVGNW